MHSKNLLSLTIASAALFGIAAPAGAAVVFDFDAAAISAFRNWSPPGQSQDGSSQDEKGDRGPQDLPQGLSEPPGSSMLLESDAPSDPLPTDPASPSVPEPTSLALLGLGLAAVAASRRRATPR